MTSSIVRVLAGLAMLGAASAALATRPAVAMLMATDVQPPKVALAAVMSVTHAMAVVALRPAVTAKAMAASPALVICSNAVARLPAAPMGLRRSARPMPRPVVQANPLRPTNRASARHAPDL